MAKKTPKQVHMVNLVRQGKRSQFLALTAAALAKQMRPHLAGVPAPLVPALARLVTDYQGRLDLAVRHVSTLTSSPAPLPKALQQPQGRSTYGEAPSLSSADTERH